MSSPGRSELPIIAPNLQRSHTLVLKSFHPRSQLLRDLVLWHFGVTNHCSGSSKHSHPCSHSPCMAGIHLLFFCSQQLIYIWDTPTLTKPGVVLKKCSLWQREIGRFDLFAQPARVFIHSIAHIRRFSIPSLLFTLYLETASGNQRVFAPPLDGSFATCASETIWSESFIMCGNECCENHIPQKNSRQTRREKKRKLMKECRSKVLLFYTQQTDKTDTKHVLFKN